LEISPEEWLVWVWAEQLAAHQTELGERQAVPKLTQDICPENEVEG